MKIELIDYTKNAEDILIFAKHTRRMDSEKTITDIKNLTKEEKEKELNYIFRTISSSWEFVDYTFLIKDVTRAFTHQLVRQRVGTSFAQQTLRIDKKYGFKYYTNNNLIDNYLYKDSINKSFETYSKLKDEGINPQDARGVLPINIFTNILMKINLRALNSMMNTRLCVRAGGEFQNCAKMIREKIIEIHPWTEVALRPFCLEWGTCKFQGFNKCPIKSKFTSLQKTDEELDNMKKTWEKIIGYSPQPE